MFSVGKVYNRSADLHDRYGGQRQGGIATPTGRDFLFLFTGKSGEQYGYDDGWNTDGIFIFTGEGQTGDMQFIRGNRAIRDHVQEGKTLHLFQSLGRRGEYRYVGEFICVSYDRRRGADREGNQRSAIVFHLVKLEDAFNDAVPEPDLALTQLRERAQSASQSASELAATNAIRNTYARSAAVKRYVLARSNGQCELCEEPAPFKRADGSPYLEPHHTRRVSDGGPDHPRWVAALCPNCHREIHSGIDGTRKNKALQEHLATLELRAGGAF